MRGPAGGALGQAHWALLQLLGSQRAEGRSAPNLLPRPDGLDPFPPSNAANACSGPFTAAKNTRKTPEVGGFLIGAKLLESALVAAHPSVLRARGLLWLSGRAFVL